MAAVIGATLQNINPHCCRACEETAKVPLFERKFIVCSLCGNKRCPKAEDHGFRCTNSNELGQIAELDVKPLSRSRPSACSIPAPDGWECVLGDGHDGVCARTPTRDLEEEGMWTPEPVATDEALTARYHRALDIINALVPLVPPTAFAWPPAQDALREAHAMLVEEGRQVAADEEAKRAAHTQEATKEWLGKRGMR